MQPPFIPLTEGQYYDFKVAGLVTGPDGHNNFKLIDPNGYKHLLESAPYRLYNLQVGATVKCRLDHINCSGKIFIEPVHPHYTVGSNYNFNVLGFRTVVNPFGFKEKMAIIMDEYGNKLLTPVNPESPELKTISAKVIRIKKGQIHVSTDLGGDDFSDIPHHQYHAFEIIGIRTISPKYEFYVLKDQAGRVYHLRTKYYQKYQLHLGKPLLCRMIRTDAGFLFEPEHPCYVIGQVYPFEIVGETSIFQYPANQVRAYEIKNEYGKNLLVPAHKIKINNKNSRELTGRVTDIIKSEVFVDFEKKALSG